MGVSGEALQGQQLQSKPWEMVILQHTETGKGGHFWLLCHCVTQEHLTARISTPPPKNVHVHNHPLTKGRLIILSIWFSCWKFTGSEINCTMVFWEFFSVKTFFLVGREIFHFLCAFIHSKLHY